MKSNTQFLQLTTILFIAWLLTLPFGSNLLGISLGSLTIYPNLILALVLAPVGILSFKKWGKLEILVLLFLFIWLLFAISQGQKSLFLKEEIFDIRSLILQFLFALVLVGMYHSIGKQQFLKFLIMGFRCFLFILLIAGIIEFFTGIHFAGTKTQELLDLPVGNNFYAPMFIYDNQNDYLAYLIFTFLTLNLFDEKLRNNNYLQLLFLLIIYIFAIYADSNFAKISGFGLIVLRLGILSYQRFQNKTILHFAPYVVASVLLVITVFSNTLFFGPKYENSAIYRLNSVQIAKQKNGFMEVISAKKQLSKSEQNQVIGYLDSINTKNPEGATNLRKNLILNGIDFIKSAPVFGLGPGGFALKIKRNDHKYFIHTHTSPHNYPLEIISEFGVFGWSYFVIILIILGAIIKIHNFISRIHRIALIQLLIVIPLLWMMPSAYLYLTINWLFLPLLLIQLLLIQEKSILNDH